MVGVEPRKILIADNNHSCHGKVFLVFAAVSLSYIGLQRITLNPSTLVKGGIQRWIFTGDKILF